MIDVQQKNSFVIDHKKLELYKTIILWATWNEDDEAPDCIKAFVCK